MSGFDFKKIAGVSFEEIFGSDQEGISYRRVETFLNKVVTIASENAQTSPNQLVRVVTDGNVMWMTLKQASHFMEMGGTSEIKKDIERALRGDLKVIRQELEILLAIALYTLQNFVQNDLIHEENVKRIEPGLQRRQKEINEGVSQTSNSEATLLSKRKRNPLIDEYELIMGEFLNEKSKGNVVRATELARFLNDHKKKYLLLTRSIEPDVRTIYYHRLNLQKTKRRILYIQNDLSKSRQEAVLLELDALQDQLDLVRNQIDHAEGDAAIQRRIEEGFEVGSIPVEGIPPENFENTQREIELKNTELSALKQESAIIGKQEQDVSAVIDYIAENVLQEPSLKGDIQQAIQSANVKGPVIVEDSAPRQETKKPQPRMHISQER